MKTKVSSPKILVTGATGRQGGSGRAAVEALLGRGLAVRALVRTLDERAQALSHLGVEVVVGDFGDHESLVRALDGIESAYFCYPVGGGIAEAAGLFAAAGRQQGLQRVVDLSLGTSRPDSPSPQGRAQWVAEQIFEWAGFDGIHLRIAAFFMENIALIDASSIRANGEIANAFGDHPLSWISGADVGRIAAHLLVEPTLLKDRVLLLGGVERLSYVDIAAKIQSIVGKPVAYRELMPDEWHQRLVEASAAKGEVNARGADHLVAQAAALRQRPPLPVTNQFLEITGSQPTSFSAFVEARRDQLTPT